MNPGAYSGKRLDAAGVTVSTLCAIHCAIMPLAVGGLATGGLGWLGSEKWEWILVGSSFVLGLSSLIPACRNLHRKKCCLQLFICGILSILIGRLASQRSLPDTPFLVLGAMLIVFAHAVNRHLCIRCRRCSSRGPSPCDNQ